MTTPTPDDSPNTVSRACGKHLGTTCHRGTQSDVHHGTVPPWHEYHPSTTCHRGTICRGEGRTPSAKYDQLQRVSDARPVREGGLLPTISSLAWFPQSRPMSGGSCEAGETMVLMSPAKVQDTIAYLEKRGLIKGLESEARRDLPERQPFTGSGCRLPPGTRCHPGRGCHPGR